MGKCTDLPTIVESLVPSWTILLRYPLPPDRLDDKALGDLRPPSSSARSTTPCETEPGTAQFANSPSTPSINQTSLTEATASVNRGLLGLPEPDLQRQLQQQPQADATASRVRNAGQDEVQSRPSPMLTPGMSHVGAPGAIIDGLPGAECSPSPTRVPRYVHSNQVQVIPFGDRNNVSWKLCRHAMKRRARRTKRCRRGNSNNTCSSNTSTSRSTPRICRCPSRYTGI